jgi:hypothetical protein
MDEQKVTPPTERLDELNADEMFDVSRHMRPGLTRAEFDVMWNEFHAEKDARLARRSQN